MNQNYRPQDGWQSFSDPQQPEVDPYERGFADKLYEDGYEPDYTADGAQQEAWQEQPRQAEPGRREQPRRRAYDYGYYPENDPRDPQQGRRPAAPPRERRQQPRQSETVPKTGGKKRRSPVKRFFKSLLAVLLVLVLALTAFLFLFPKQPKDAACDWVRKKDNTTILLVGTDKAADNTDTIMLLNIDRASRAIHLMSIPRDTRVDSSYWPHKINGAYSANGGGEDGIEALMGYVTDCVGFRPDGYVMIDLSCFIDLVDLFGGVEFNVPQDMFYDDPAQDLHIALNAGEQTLDGEQAMGLVRYRYGYTMADLDRVNVQRAFIQAAIEQWAKPKNVLRLLRALFVVEKHCTTDLSARNLLWLAESMALCGTSNMQMETVPYYLDDIYVNIAVNDDYIWMLNDRYCPYDRWISYDDLHIVS